jgi:hypothetical protein
MSFAQGKKLAVSSVTLSPIHILTIEQWEYTPSQELIKG